MQAQKTRRSSSLLLVLAVAAIIIWPADARALERDAVWEHYKKTFISPDGRVMDPRQEQHSTSEGQGYGMLLAFAHSDREAFERLWAWTRDNLAVRRDGLLAWKWGQRPNGRWEVVDFNNATDGDILVAYALLRASGKWGVADYTEQAKRIIRAIREELAVERGGRLYLLPGYYGFAKPDTLVLNPSYVIMPAYSQFGKSDDPVFWDRALKDGMRLMSSACIGSPCLPADWVSVPAVGNLSLMDRAERMPYFGFEAIRAVLHIAWHEPEAMPSGVGSMLDIYRKLGYVPLWADLETGGVSLKDASAGFYAIYARAARSMGDKATAERLLSDASRRLASEGDDYYSYSLYLLAVSEGLP